MSTYYAVRCDDCEADGPQIRRTAGGVSLAGEIVHGQPRDDAGAERQWSTFLLVHEYHRLRLIHEAQSP